MSEFKWNNIKRQKKKDLKCKKVKKKMFKGKMLNKLRVDLTTSDNSNRF